MLGTRIENEKSVDNGQYSVMSVKQQKWGTFPFVACMNPIVKSKWEEPLQRLIDSESGSISCQSTVSYEIGSWSLDVS